MYYFKTAGVTALMVIIFAAQMVFAGQLTVANDSFEMPHIDPNAFPAIPVALMWIEADVDTAGSTNTGVFRNPPANSPYGDHIVNADANQLAFLASQTGNGFKQNLSAVYQPGKSYRLTVEVCPSARYHPSGPDPNNHLVLSLHYLNDANAIDIVTSNVPSTELVNNFLKPFSVTLSDVHPRDAWAGKTIGIAILAAGVPGGYWDLDKVTVVEYQSRPDFTDDSFVDYLDFAKTASQWQSCTDVTADTTGDGCVDMGDLLILVDYWLSYV